VARLPWTGQAFGLGFAAQKPNVHSPVTAKKIQRRSGLRLGSLRYRVVEMTWPSPWAQDQRKRKRALSEDRLSGDSKRQTLLGHNLLLNFIYDNADPATF
jgi:hypothetical protein